MSQPVPTPGAPANPALPTPTPGAPAPTPVPTPPAAPAWSPDSLPPEGKAWLDKQIADADKKSRLGTQANAAADAEKAMALRLAQALNLAPTQDGPPTVDSLAQNLTDMQARLDAADARAAEAEAMASISRIAGRLGGNAEAILDSNRIVTKLNAVEADSQQAYDAAVEAILTAELAANPALKAAGSQGPSRQGVDVNGAGNGHTRVLGLGASVGAAYKQQ